MLLAKYIEHQVAADTTNDANTTCGTEKERAIRVLELGCGTGLAGLAAAFSMGRRRGEGGRGTPPQPPVARPLTEVEVVLTDLPYALDNARENIARNAETLAAARGEVAATELDWCRPLPQGLVGELVV